MKTPEEFYNQSNYPVLDKHDKKAEKFTYYDMLEFAEAYATPPSEEHEFIKKLKERGLLADEPSPWLDEITPPQPTMEDLHLNPGCKEALLSQPSEEERKELDKGWEDLRNSGLDKPYIHQPSEDRKSYKCEECHWIGYNPGNEGCPKCHSEMLYPSIPLPQISDIEIYREYHNYIDRQSTPQTRKMAWYQCAKWMQNQLNQ